MKRYDIWDKKSPVITPIGEVFTAEQWIDRYPVAAIDSIHIVCAAGEMNGAFFGTLGQMVEMYERNGCDFSNCNTAEEKLSAIEAFEDEQEAIAKEMASMPSVEERQATALEAIATGATSENTAAMNALLTGEE